MPDVIVANPLANFSKPADFTTYLDKDGNLIQYGATFEVFRANAAIDKWAPVSLVGAVAATPLSVKELVVAELAFTCIGVAQEAGVAGDLISVCTRGVTLVQIDTDDPVFGDIVVVGGGNGQVGSVAQATWSADATAAAGPGKALGIFLDVEGTTDVAPIYFHKF